MTSATPLAPTPLVLPDREVEGLDLRRAGAVDLRRDLYRFVGFVLEAGLVRTVRGNEIPLAAARKLAKLLSWAGEAAAVEEKRRGVWSDAVSMFALRLGLVAFDLEGEYRGYTSSEPSFPDNEILVQEKAWRAWLGKTPGEKERALLAALLEATPNEFFHPATLLPGAVFDSAGCAIGPAGKMTCARIRRGLLDRLGRLDPAVWYDLRDFVARLGAEAPELILDPTTRSPDAASARRLHDWEWACERTRKGPKPPRPPVTFLDLYQNFREPPPKTPWAREEEYQITTQTPDAFHRVEGRYVEFFLREIPYLMGFVDLAYRGPRDRHGLDVSPPFERLRAFRLTRRFFSVWRKDPEFDRVITRVLPNHEILLEAPSYPDRELARLAPYAAAVKEDGPMVHLKLDRGRVVAAVAADPAHRGVAEVLAELAGSALPANVAVELADWCGQGERATLYENAALVEVRDEAARDAVRAQLGNLVLDDRGEGILIVRSPAQGFTRLEEGDFVPVRVTHPECRFAPSDGKLGQAREAAAGVAPAVDGAAAAAVPAPSPPRRAVTLSCEDLVAYRCDDAEFLEALQAALGADGSGEGDRESGVVRAGTNRLLVPAAALPKVRAALRRLAERFDIER